MRSPLTCFLIRLCFWIHFFNADFGKSKWVQALLREHIRARALLVRSSFLVRVCTHLTVLSERGLSSQLGLKCTNIVHDQTVRKTSFPWKMRGLFMMNIAYFALLAFKFLARSASSVPQYSKSIKPWSKNEWTNRQRQNTMHSWVQHCHCNSFENVRAVVWNFCVPPFLGFTQRIKNLAPPHNAPHNLHRGGPLTQSIQHYSLPVLS